MECHDELPFNTYGSQALAEQYPAFANFVLGQAEYVICPIWGAAEAGGIGTRAVSWPVPTLLWRVRMTRHAAAWAYSPPACTSYVYEFPAWGTAFHWSRLRSGSCRRS